MLVTSDQILDTLTSASMILARACIFLPFDSETNLLHQIFPYHKKIYYRTVEATNFCYIKVNTSTYIEFFFRLWLIRVPLVRSFCDRRI